MSRIASLETVVVQLPTRREHKWMTDADGRIGWGEAAALKDGGGEFGRYFGESAAIVELIIARYLAPAVKGVDACNIVELHARMDAVI